MAYRFSVVKSFLHLGFIKAPRPLFRPSFSWYSARAGFYLITKEQPKVSRGRSASGNSLRGSAGMRKGIHSHTIKPSMVPGGELVSRCARSTRSRLIGGSGIALHGYPCGKVVGPIEKPPEIVNRPGWGNIDI